MQAVNLKAFKKKVELNGKAMKRFLTKIEKAPPRGLDSAAGKLHPEVWAEVDCLSCANCCKTMTPTYTKADIIRIASHFKQTPQQFKDQWLKYDKKDGDWQNKTEPCQFLNLKDNKCSIYEIRPLDCAGFPHLPKKKMVEYMHVHKQNIDFCPATYKLVEKMQRTIS